jgi:hypothetical protein
VITGRQGLASLFASLLMTACGSYSFIVYEIRPYGSAIVDGTAKSSASYQAAPVFRDRKGAVEYRDDLIEVKWHVASDRLSIHVANLGEEAIQIVWSEALLDDGMGKHPLHLGDPGPESVRKPPQSPTEVLPGQRTPIMNVVVGLPIGWQPFTNEPGSGFVTGGRPLFGISPSAGDSETKAAVGKRLTLYLPIDLGESRRLYVFPAEVEQSHIQKVTEYLL